MKKLIIVALASSLILSCNREMDRALKSADKDYILKTANEKFAKKKWSDAIALYERVSNLVAGTDEFPNVGFNTAFANYYDKNYKLAGHQFKNFAVSFPQDPRREEAAYMSAICYYQGSYDYNLDQTNTQSAINELQEFLNNYPDSERSKNIQTMLDELGYKLEFKAYENARQYFKMGEYLAADVAFDNVLEDFPATKLRAKILDFKMKSKYELALFSMPEKKKDRLDNAIAYTKTIEKELPNTDYAKTALAFRPKLEEEKVKFEKLVADAEKRQAEFAAKQKAEEEKNAAKDQLKKEEKEQDATQRSIEKARKDSATVSDPNSTFRIRR
ncbi:outer membrane protein assembly factor BamD [Chryseobacterium sp. POL2]|uniref:outer membrane protein assembly factor BamD n=1 Tax=Chryseobacterium sp. POL2 TaxID=2713414 RepID=UPI0013E12D2A|nr:outer membrane protein assembly factor BamD [Chryseobacterium sp. POL2]QIG89962.1 outer membrane protein assembly factor BamD [Chryseobacterium sp. POL2]